MGHGIGQSTFMGDNAESHSDAAQKKPGGDVLKSFMKFSKLTKRSDKVIQEAR